MSDKSDNLPGSAVRPAMEDITNDVGKKRGFSLVSPCPNSPSKSGNPTAKPAQFKSDSDDTFLKEITMKIDNLKKERCDAPNCPNYTTELYLPPSQIRAIEQLVEVYGKGDSNDPFVKTVLIMDKLKRPRCTSAKCPKVEHADGVKGGNSIDPSAISGSSLRKTQMGIPNCADDVKEPSNLVLNTVDLGEGQVLPNVVNVGDIAKKSCISNLELTVSSRTCMGNCIEAGKNCECEKTIPVCDLLEKDCTQRDLDEKDDAKTVYVDFLACSRSESVVNSRMESLDSRSFELERCPTLTGDRSNSSAADPDLLKSCSCSFCAKAAYIWSDLYYQDVKGRISLLTKSKKEASNLAQRYSNENGIGKNGLGNSTEATNLELDLMKQWKSLFLQMENSLCDEGSQLQTNLLALKDLRDEFKTDLESVNASTSFAQKLPSAASDTDFRGLLS